MCYSTNVVDGTLKDTVTCSPKHVLTSNTELSDIEVEVISIQVKVQQIKLI